MKAVIFKLLEKGYNVENIVKMGGFNKRLVYYYKQKWVKAEDEARTLINKPV